MLERWLFELDNCCESTSVTYALRTLFKDSILERLIKTDMVALPVIDQRTAGQSHTTTKLVPRKGASDTWRDEMADILAAHELTRIVQDSRPPSIEEIQQSLPGVPIDIVEAVHEAALRAWWTDATRLYHIVRASIELSGLFEKMDLSMIKAEFCFGDFRNGPSLLRWATSFTKIRNR